MDIKLMNHPSRINASSSVWKSFSGWPALIIGATLLIQFILASISFPLSELLTDKPLFNIDSPYHWYRMILAASMTATSQGTVFDPYFGAGYLAGPAMDLSGHLPAFLAAHLNGWWDELVIYKIYVFVAALLGPGFLALGAIALRLHPRVIVIASAFGLILWWASVFRWYHTAGMVSFVAASYLSILFIALMIRLLSQPSWSETIVLGLLGAGCFYYHLSFPFPIIFFTPIYLALNWQAIDLRSLARVMIVVPAMSVVPNLPWLVDVFRSGIDSAWHYQSYVDINLIWRELLGIWSGHAQGAKVYAPLALSSLVAACCAGNAQERKLSLAFTLTGWLLIVYAFLGAAVGAVQPNRFAPVGYLMFCIPASIGVFTLFEGMRSATTQIVRYAAGAGICIVVLATLFAANELRREVSYADVGHYGKPPPEVSGLGPYSQWIMQVLKRETTAQGRVLFEISRARLTDNAQMPPYYAFVTNREFIGGPGPYFTYVRSVTFMDGVLGDKPVRDYDAGEFQNYLTTYNIGWIFANSDESKRFMDGLPFVIAVDEFKKFKAYRVDLPLNYFVKGSGEIEFHGHNRIKLSGLNGEDIVVKYHYFPGMQADPQATLSPYQMPGDPIPFIEIKNPPRELTLSMP